MGSGINAEYMGSRMATDLANERTLLAWLRTILAIVRTAFAYLSIKDHGIWKSVELSARAGLFAAVLGGGVTGWLRYNVIKELTFKREIPKRFGRFSIKFFNYWV